MYVNSQAGGTSQAFPDVCKTPAPNGTVPVPYPNIAQGSMAKVNTASKKVLIQNMNGHTQQTVIAISNGDEAGTAGGTTSGKFIGPMKWKASSKKVKFENKPVTRMNDATGQNGNNPNASGTTIAPSQTKVRAN